MRDSFSAQIADSAFAAATATADEDEFPLDWKPRMDVETTAEGIHAYLEEQNVTLIVENILQQALATAPDNVCSFVIDELVSRLLQEQACRPSRKALEAAQAEALEISDMAAGTLEPSHPHATVPSAGSDEHVVSLEEPWEAPASSSRLERAQSLTAWSGVAAAPETSKLPVVRIKVGLDDDGPAKLLFAVEQ